MKTNPNDSSADLTKREVFAKAAMQGYCANAGATLSSDRIARMAADQADSLIYSLNETAAPESPVAAEAAENDKAIEEMNEDKVEWLAKEMFSVFIQKAEEGLSAECYNAMYNNIFVGNTREAWLSVARAAIDHLKESKWKAIALDLCAHLRKTLPVMDDAREDARRLGRQSVVDAFDRQTDAARTAIVQAEREGGAQ